MKQRTIMLALAFLLCVHAAATPASAAARDTAVEETLAAELKELNLFRGVSDTEFDLRRTPNRVEALVMLIRLMGVEDDALSQAWGHPFRDVPLWADRYVGYAYVRGLTNGVSAREYGAGEVTAAQFLTFVVRALNYSDANGDFAWDDPYRFAESAGILPARVNLTVFWRADAVTVSHAALTATVKGNGQTLAERLIEVGVFTADAYRLTYKSLPDLEAAYAEAREYEPELPADPVENVHYEWDWLRWTWSYDLRVPVKAVQYYRSLERDPREIRTGYSSYVSDPSDDEYLHALAQKFIDAAESEDQGKDAAVELAIAFVQALDYIPDDDSLGYDYPKYPLETLYDHGGDCEDTSVLLVSLIREMGYGCCLIAFDDHMGAGVLGGDSVWGRYFERNGKKYFYVETTSPDWQIGEMPQDYINRRATVWPF